MTNTTLTKEEIEELYEARGAWEDSTDREKFLLCEAILDLMIEFKKKNK